MASRDLPVTQQYAPSADINSLLIRKTGTTVHLIHVLIKVSHPLHRSFASFIHTCFGFDSLVVLPFPFASRYICLVVASFGALDHG